MATVTDMHSTFDNYFNGEGTQVSFSLTEKGKRFDFIREDHYHEEPQYVSGFKDYIEFRRAFKRYSRWGNCSPKFTLKLDDQDLVIYDADRDNIYLSTMLNHVDKTDLIQRDGNLFIRKAVFKRMMRQIEDGIIDMVKEAYKEAIDAKTKGSKKNAII